MDIVGTDTDPGEAQHQGVLKDVIPVYRIFHQNVGSVSIAMPAVSGPVDGLVLRETPKA